MSEKLEDGKDARGNKRAALRRSAHSAREIRS
jgi:hypothetical protein